MLPRQQRLKREEISRILKKGKGWRGQGLSLKIAPLLSQPSTPSQVAIIVTSGTVRTAVTRNRLKRRLRQWVIRHRSQIRPGQGVIILAYPPAAKLTIGDLGTMLQLLFTRAKMLTA
ncbi:MAG: ribonuclease P protein component [Patescibacteria group bacterium]|nr:ribonuclease P protein component [Patescibacteria group bacterium]